MSGARNDDFYANLPGIEDFDGFAGADAYRPVPEDWVILTADIVGSTPAIEAGRYKDVNMIGAAVIAAVLNAAPGLELPFLFGGDGGTVLVPSRLRDDAERALRGLQRFSAATFDLPLRAAAVPVARVRAEGLDVRVGKLRLSPGNDLAMFAGGGLARADSIMKARADGDANVLVPTEDGEAPDLEGLSCRWEPLEPQNGRMIAIIVKPQRGQDAQAVLSGTLRDLSRILGGPLTAHAPVSDAALRFRFPPRGLVLEARAAAAGGLVAAAWVRALVSAALQWLAEKRALKIGPYDQPRYRAELKRQTDFRKFDDALRVVLDVTHSEAAAIEAHLAEAHRAGRLLYGLHVADRALMTCLVFSLDRSEHVHFVDAAGGGFAAAAKRLKGQVEAGGGSSEGAGRPRTWGATSGR